MANAGAAEGPIPPGLDPEIYDRTRRRVLWAMPAGLYLLGSRSGEDRNLMTTSLVIQVSVSPKLIGTSIESSAKTLSLIRASSQFALSLLAKSDRALVRKFVKPAMADENGKSLNGVEYLDASPSGAPVPSVALGYLDCKVREELDLGSHVFVIGEVQNAVILAENFDEAEVLSMSDVRMSYGG